MSSSPTPTSRPGHRTAVLQALFVTFLWSTSWVLIKRGLGEIPPLAFAGLRYAVAASLLSAVLLGSPQRRAALRSLEAGEWRALLLLGLVAYTLTQGAQFLALAHLPAQTVSLTLSLTPVVVALLGMAWLSERLAPWQWLGIGLVMVGSAVYYLPLASVPITTSGWVAALVGLLANAGSSLLGRSVNRGSRLDPLVITTVSMAAGAAALLVAGGLTTGIPRLSAESWAIVSWLAVVNTAFAFTLWNLTLRRLAAVESSILANTMVLQIAVLAFLFMGEPLGVKQLGAFLLVLAGTVAVQWRAKNAK